MAWGDKELDREVLEGTAESDSVKEQQGVIVKERGQYAAEHHHEGLVIFKCRGAEFHIAANLATQTSTYVQELIAKHMRAPASAGPLVVASSGDPYVMDRIVDFWLRTSLFITKEKEPTHAKTWPNNAADTNSTYSMSTVYLLSRIYYRSIFFGDEHLGNATLAELRQYILSPELGHTELLEVATQVYNSEEFEEYMYPLKRILLAGVVIHSKAIRAGAGLRRLQESLAKNPRFFNDYIEGIEYYARTDMLE